MQYNSSREHLRLREYGRNFQMMVNHLKTVEDKEKRTKLAKGVVELMGQMNPNIGGANVEEYKQMLWDSFYIMSDFDIDVDGDFPMPAREMVNEKPPHPGYPRQRIKFRHYGKNVQTMIDKAAKMTDPEKKEAFTTLIGNYMKLVHRNWNRDDANDQVVMEDMVSMSKNQLKVGEDVDLDILVKAAGISNPQYQNSRSNNKKGGGKRRPNNKGRSNNNRRR